MGTLLVDSHVHLQADVFDVDRDAVILRATEAGVGVFVCNGSSPDDWEAVFQLAQADKKILPHFGLHPWYVNQVKGLDWLTPLGDYLTRTPSGVGEIGLDRWIKDFDIEAQLDVFRSQMSLARELNRPVAIHCLHAWGILLEQLSRSDPLPAGLLIHAFSGSSDLVRPLADMGAYFSFAGNILDPGRRRSQESLLEVPIDRLLIETDSPDIPPPAQYRIPGLTLQDSKYRNEPANLPAVLDGIARLRGESAGRLADQLWENGQRLWKELL